MSRTRFAREEIEVGTEARERIYYEVTGDE